MISNHVCSWSYCHWCWRLGRGWVTNLYQQSARKWVFTAIKSCLIQVMAHRKALRMDNNSVGNSRCQCAHFPGYVKHELYVVKRRGLKLQLWGKGLGFCSLELYVSQGFTQLAILLFGWHVLLVSVSISNWRSFFQMAAFLVSGQTNTTNLSPWFGELYMYLFIHVIFKSVFTCFFIYGEF